MKWFFRITIFLLLIPVQTLLLEKIQIAGVKPDLALILVYCFSWAKGEIHGLLWGSPWGADRSFSVGLLGVNFILKTTIGLTIGMLGRSFLNLSLLWNVLIFFFISILHDFLGTLLVEGMREGSLFLMIQPDMVGRALYNSLLQSGFYFSSRREEVRKDHSIMRESYFPQEETRDLQSRIYWLFGLIVLALCALLLRAWYLQVVKGQFYYELSENNRIRVVETPPPRGLIYDRNGALLVNNVPSFNLYVVLGDMPDQTAVLSRLADLIGMPQEEIVRRVTFKKEDPFFPIKIKDDLTMKEVALIEGHGLDLPGVKIEAEFKRNAIHGNLAAHLLGYVGEITQSQLESGSYQNLKRGIIGQYGIEQSFDAVIRGIPGQKRIEVDALGHEIRVLEVNEPQRGNDVFLTVDLNVQKVAEEALGGRNGAIVAMDPKNGEVLAMVSHPAFNPNLLSQGASSAAWEAILKDEGRPLTNRVIQGQYPPGSTFKIVMGAALLEMKEASPASRVECRGFLPFGNRNFRDWKRGGHGTVDLHKAMVESCDVYFYEMGNRLGVDNIAKFSHLFGLGHPTGIELASEKGGLIPSTEWKRQVRKEPWYPGETLSVSIGQGYVTTTPLQLAMMTTMVANKGISYPPQLLKKIWDRETGSMQEIPTAEGKRIPISPETFRVLHAALAGVVSDPRGTANASKSEFVSIGGKTGTAQVIGMKGGAHGKLPDKFNDHAWFVAFAPVESPKIAVVVLVENGGHGGSAAAPLSKKLIEAYLGIASPLEPITVKSPASPPSAIPSEG